MQVKTVKEGFYGTALRKPAEDGRPADVFDFAEFKINADGTHNLGSWMEPTEKGLKTIAAMEEELDVKMMTREEVKAAEIVKADVLESENKALKAEIAALKASKSK